MSASIGAVALMISSWNSGNSLISIKRARPFSLWIAAVVVIPSLTARIPATLMVWRIASSSKLPPSISFPPNPNARSSRRICCMKVSLAPGSGECVQFGAQLFIGKNLARELPWIVRAVFTFELGRFWMCLKMLSSSALASRSVSLSGTRFHRTSASSSSCDEVTSCAIVRASAAPGRILGQIDQILEGWPHPVCSRARASLNPEDRPPRSRHHVTTNLDEEIHDCPQPAGQTLVGSNRSPGHSGS